MAVYESVEFVPFDLPGHDVLVRYVHGVLDGLGVRFGAAHTEVMMTADGPRLIECAARLSGGGLPYLCAQATGENAVDRLVRYLSGDREIDDRYTLRESVMTVLFLVPASGILRNAEVYQAIGQLPTVTYRRCTVRTGDRVSASSDLWSSLNYGFVVLAHTDAERVHADRAKVRELEASLIIE
jgi:biotin carboxylase